MLTMWAAPWAGVMLAAIAPRGDRVDVRGRRRVARRDRCERPVLAAVVVRRTGRRRISAARRLSFFVVAVLAVALRRRAPGAPLGGDAGGAVAEELDRRAHPGFQVDLGLPAELLERFGRLEVDVAGIAGPPFGAR